MQGAYKLAEKGKKIKIQAASHIYGTPPTQNP